MMGIRTLLLHAWVLPVVLCLPAHHNEEKGIDVSDYDKYLEDMSNIGKEISCTDQEKECYKFRRVLYQDGGCYVMSHVGPCNNSELHFNKEKAQKGEYKPECTPSYPCGTPNQMFTAHDQTCHKTSLVNEVCDYKRNLTASQNNYGDIECRCFGDSCPPRPVITQPEEPGRCLLPDLSLSVFPYWGNPLAYRRFPCSEEQYGCYKEGKMLHEADGACYRPLERGPCAEGELFAANKTAFDEQRLLQGACVRPTCPSGQLRFQFDQRCYPREDIETKLCPPHIVVSDIFGDAGCGFEQDVDVGSQLPKQIIGENKCAGIYREYID